MQCLGEKHSIDVLLLNTLHSELLSLIVISLIFLLVLVPEGEIGQWGLASTSSFSYGPSLLKDTFRGACF